MYGFSRYGGQTISTTLADCSQSLASPDAAPSTSDFQPIVIGLGSVTSIAVFRTSTGPAWCFDGMGTGGGGISRAEMRSSLVAPVAVVDGGLTSDVLMLVHLGQKTTSVVVTTADSRSIVLAHGGGFEVLRVPMTWPHWHPPWRRSAVTFGRIMGFNAGGRVTSSLAFTWCPGSFDEYPATVC